MYTGNERAAMPCVDGKDSAKADQGGDEWERGEESSCTRRARDGRDWPRERDDDALKVDGNNWKPSVGYPWECLRRVKHDQRAMSRR